MSDSLNLGLHVIGGETKPQLPKMKSPNRKAIRNRILALLLPDGLSDILVRRLQDYPDGALSTFWDKLPDMVETLKLQKAKGEI